MILINKDKMKETKSELVVHSLLLAAAVLSVFITLGIILSLLLNTFSFFQKVSIFEFLTGKEWTPLFANPQYGVLPLITGTLTVTLVAAFIAIPLGLASAIFLSEYSPPSFEKS